MTSQVWIKNALYLLNVFRLFYYNTLYNTDKDMKNVYLWDVMRLREFNHGLNKPIVSTLWIEEICVLGSRVEGRLLAHFLIF
jgi:hypothetical protein